MQIDDTIYQHVRAQHNLEDFEQRFKALEQAFPLSSWLLSANTTTFSILLSAIPLHPPHGSPGSPELPE